MKYKLIKEYPGSPSLGTIAKYSESHGAIEFTSPKGKLHYSGSDAINFFENLVSNHPEFWEEVVEKDYEILSFKQDSACSDLWTKFGHGWCRNSNGIAVTWPYTDDEILNNHLINGIKYNIHSVKRLSDGEVFTIGDKVMWDTVQITIKEFHITYANVLWCVGSTGTKLNLKSVQHVKQPLFTTEDGVDIYKGDKFTSVYKCNLHQVDIKANLPVFSSSNFKFFSTKEKAEEYILLNKPCLSIQDVLNMYVFDVDVKLSISNTKENLKEIVKERLK